MARKSRNQLKPTAVSRRHCRTPQGEVKVIFPTELDVKIELAKHALYDTSSRGYKCRFRNHWHITTQDAHPENEREDQEGPRER